MFEAVKLVRKKALEAAKEKEIASLQERFSEKVSELLTKLSQVEVAKNEAGERARVAEETCARVTACHAGQERIGHMPIDPLAMTARAKAVEGSLRCVWSEDHMRIVFYADRPLTEAEFNAMVSVALPEFNRT